MSINHYGKHFKRAYTGSLRGAGLGVWAVWGYCIGNAEPPGLVELYPGTVADALGTTEEEVAKAISFLMSEDPKSRSDVKEGRRLEWVSEYIYRMINWEKYDALSGNDEQRDYWRRKKAESRIKRQSNGEETPQLGSRFVKPTLDQLKLHCAKTGLPDDMAEQFLAYYNANGWKVGKAKVPMQSWQKAMVTWKKNFEERKASEPLPPSAVGSESAEEEYKRNL